MRSIFFFLFFFFLYGTAVRAQAPTICLFYDQAGNRINRVTCCTACLTDSGDGANALQATSAERKQAEEDAGEMMTGRIIPNPNDGHFEIALSRAAEGGIFEVFSGRGELILRQAAQGERNSFSLPEVPSGNYYLILKSSGQMLGQWIILKN